MLKSSILSVSAITIFALFSMNAYSAVGAKGYVPWPSTVNEKPCVNAFPYGRAEFSAWEDKARPWSKSTLKVTSSAMTQSRYIQEKGVGCPTNPTAVASKIAIKYKAVRMLGGGTHYDMAQASNSDVHSTYVYAEDNRTWKWNSGYIPGCITSKHTITRGGVVMTNYLQVQNAGPACFTYW